MRQAKRLCAPANKNDEDPTAPNDPAHLTAYTIEQTSPHFEAHRDIQVVPDNPLFDPLTIDLIRPERLLVPTAKNVGTQIPPPLAAPIDHYKCYRVRGTRTRVRGVSVETQFGPVTVDIKRPLHLCTPVDKNGEGIVDSVRHLMCYKVRAVPQRPLTVSTNNQFEKETFQIFGLRELCVPAFKSAPGTCGDHVLNAPGEKCDPPGPNASCELGVCKSDCTCAAPCRELGAAGCSVSEDCCNFFDGASCSVGTCCLPLSDGLGARGCRGDADCCAGNCHTFGAGNSGCCFELGTTGCSASGDCCNFFDLATCEAGKCCLPLSHGDGAHVCRGDADCCAGTCHPFAPGNNGCCFELGTTGCSASEDCCNFFDGATCVAGTCQGPT